MNPNASPPRLRAGRRPWFGVLAFVALAGAVPRGAAQPVINLPPAAELVPASMRKSVPGTVNPRTARAAPPARAPERTPFFWGPFSLYPYFSNSFLYSDGVQTRPGEVKSTYLNTLRSGFRLDAGTSWAFDYGTTWSLYSSDSFSESLDHAVRFSGARTIRDWQVGFLQSYATMTAPRIETGRQTGTESVTTSFSLGRAINHKLSVAGVFNQSLSFTTTSPDSYTWSGNGSVNYQISSRLAAGGVVTVGYTDMDPGVNMAFLLPAGTLSWIPSEKITFTATVGEEIRQTYSRGVSARFTPSFSLSGGYRPFRQTSVTLSATRSVQPSVLRNQVNDTTSWTVALAQRLLRHFHLTANYGEMDSGYAAVNERVVGGRRDKSYNYGVRLGTTFLRRGTIDLLYQGTHNASNAGGFGVDSTQMGVDVGFRY